MTLIFLGTVINELKLPLKYLPGRHRKIAEYYKKQDKLMKGYNEVDSFSELGILPGALTEVS